MKPISKVRKYVYISLGILLTGIGILGIVTPVLPTTVFLILASWLFIRSSPGLHRWLNKNRVTGPYVRAYTEKKGLPVRKKVGTIILLWVTLGISAWFVRETSWLLILLGTVGLGVSIHVATIRDRSAEAGPAREDNGEKSPNTEPVPPPESDGEIA